MAGPSGSVSVSSKVDGDKLTRDKPTRYSLGKASSRKSGGMIHPRYLRPSFGSCHDFCKYGKHHEFEKKPQLRFQRRDKKTPAAKHFSVEFPEEMKKKADNKLKHQPVLKTHVLDTPEIIKREVLTTSVNVQGSRLNPKKTSEGTLTKADGSHSSVKRVTDKKKTPLQQLNLLESRSSVSSGVIHHERKNLSIHGKKSGPSDKPRTSPGLKSGLSSPIRKQNTSATSEKLEAFSELASLRPEGVDLSPKQTISSRQISSSVDALELSSGGRISDVKMGPWTRMPRIMVKKGQAPSGSFSPKRSSSRVPTQVSSRTFNTGGFSSPRASLSPKVSPSRDARGFLSPRISLTSKVSHSRNASLNAKKQGGPKVSSLPKIQNKIETDGKVNVDRLDGKNVDPGHQISDLKEPIEDLVQEKTLNVIKVETESNHTNSDVNEKVSMESSPSPSSASRKASSPPHLPLLPVHNSKDDDESEVRGQFVPLESLEITPSALVLDINTPWSENPSAEVKEEENSDYDESNCADDEKLSMESSSPPSWASPRASSLPNSPSRPVHDNQDDDKSENFSTLAKAEANSDYDESKFSEYEKVSLKSCPLPSSASLRASSLLNSPSRPIHDNQDDDKSENFSTLAKEEANSDYDESECSEYDKVSMKSCPPSSASHRASSLPNSPSLPVLNNQADDESDNSSTEAKEEANLDYDESECAKCEKVPMESSPPPSSASPRASFPPNSPSLIVHNGQDNDESENSSTEAKEEENSDYDESDCAEDEIVSMESSSPSSASHRASSLPNSPSLHVHNNQYDDESENPSAEAEEEENSDYDQSKCAKDEKVSMESSPPPSSASPGASSPPNSPSSPVHNDQDNDKSEDPSTEAKGEANSDYVESELAKDAVALKGAHRRRQRNGRLVLTEDKDCPPVKLHFRRGKVVDLLSESRTPRRLKFRRGRVLGENKNLKNHDTINFKRTEVDGKANDRHESVRVVLRHQNVQRKKNAQHLFNNVIEETASKLVETRKSKVKALVGAFETVISLQDSKPSSNMVP